MKSILIGLLLAWASFWFVWAVLWFPVTCLKLGFCGLDGIHYDLRGVVDYFSVHVDLRGLGDFCCRIRMVVPPVAPEGKVTMAKILSALWGRSLTCCGLPGRFVRQTSGAAVSAQAGGLPHCSLGEELPE